MSLSRDLFASWQKGIDLSEVDRCGTSVKPRHRTSDHLSTEFIKLNVQRVSLGLSDFLDHYLLGRLCRDPAKNRSEVVWLDIDPGALHRRLSGIAVDAHLDLRFLTVVLASCRKNCLFDPVEDNFLVDILVAMEYIDQAKKLGSVHPCPFNVFALSTIRPLRTHP